MHKRSQIEEYCTESEIEVLLLPEEFDPAIIGLTLKFNEYSVLYDRSKCIEILSKDEMSFEEAEEYFEFNIAGAYLGKSTCSFLVDVGGLS